MQRHLVANARVHAMQGAHRLVANARIHAMQGAHRLVATARVHAIEEMSCKQRRVEIRSVNVESSLFL